MIWGSERYQYRKIFFTAWLKYQNQEVLSDLEKQLIQIILQHSEYQFIFQNEEKYLQQDFFPELGDTNPFLHLSLHLALIEQLTTDIPHGIRKEYLRFMALFKDQHQVEHYIIQALSQEMHDSQQEHRPFSNIRYFELLKK